MPQYIYLLKLHGTHLLDFPRLYKIGLSGNPDQRLADIQEEWAERRGRKVTRLKLVKVWDMDSSETRLHDKFEADRVYARDHPVFTGKPLSGDTEWFYLPWPWDVAAVVRAMEGEARWAKVWDYGLPAVGIAMLSFVLWLQFGPKQLPPVRQTQSEVIKWIRN